MVIKKILIISWLCATMSLQGTIHGEISPEVDLSDEIVQAFVYGEANGIGKHFNSSVELIFNESQGVYGKSQGEQILKTFFANNASAQGKFTYKHLHGSNRDNVHYYIGELHTGKGLYRVTIYMKDKLIHRMRIESND